MRAATLAFFVACASASAAPMVVLDGDVRGVPDGIYAPVVDVLDDTGAVLTTLTLADVAVTDGLFEVELDLAAVAAQLAAGAEVSIDVELEGLSSSARLGALFAVSSVPHADAARSSATADSLGSIAPAELIQRDRVGNVSIAFANLVDVPASIADGIDTGNIDAVGTGLAITGGTLQVTSITTTQLVDGSIASAALVDGSFNSASVAALAAVDVAEGTLTTADLGTGFGIADVIGTKPTIFAQDSACASAEGGITIAPSCTRRTCGSGGRVTCGTLSCQQPSSGSTLCNNVALGRLLFAP